MSGEMTWILCSGTGAISDDDGADDMRGLEGAVDRQVAGDLVEADDALAGLERAGVDALVAQEVLGRDFGLLEGGVGQFPVADLPVEDMVRMAARPVSAILLVLDVLAQDRRVLVHRLEWVDDDGQGFVLDLDQVRGVGGDIAVGRDDEGDLLVLEQDLAVGEHHLDVAGKGRHPGQIDALEVLGGEHCEHARHGLGLGGVDLHDAGVSMARAMEVAVHHARQLDVVDVIAFALGEAHVLDALALAAHALKLFGALERSGKGSVVHSAASLNSRPAILAAAYWIAFTMFWYPVQRQRLPEMPMTDLALGRVRVLLQEPMRAHDHARRAIAALEAMHLAEALLEGAELAVGFGHALDGENVCARGLDREHGAGFDRPAVDIDRAGAAMGGVAADMRAGEAEVLAQVVDEQRPRLDGGRHRLAVDRHADIGEGHVGPFQDVARAKARLERPRGHDAGHLGAIFGRAAAVRGGRSDRGRGGGRPSEGRPDRARTRRTEAAASLASSAVAATLVRPIAQVATLPPETVRMTAAAAVA